MQQPALSVGISLQRSEVRTAYLDGLRIGLTVLVIFHHAAIAYGGSGDWFYREQRDDEVAQMLLTLFCAVNQSFFMGFFFLLAGHFTPGSLERKGVWRYLGDRILRLGMPLLVFGCVIGPWTVQMAHSSSSAVATGSAWGRFVIGPLWFAWALLIFSAVYALWRCVAPVRLQPYLQRLPRPRYWLLAALLVGMAALMLRQWVPVGEQRWGLQLGYFASYVFLFAFGCASAQRHWLDQITWTQVRLWGCISVLSIVFLPLAAVLAGALEGKPLMFETGLGWMAVFYAFWEPLVAWGIILVLIVQARKNIQKLGSIWSEASHSAYGAFVVHAPVLVICSLVLEAWPLPALIKWLLAAGSACGASFAIAAALRRVPGVSRIL